MEAREEFFADGWRVTSTWALALCTPPIIATMLWQYFSPSSEYAANGVDRGLLRLLQPISLAVIWFCVVWGLAHLRRPVASIGDRDVESGSIFRFTSRPRVLLESLVEIEVKPRSLRLHTRQGPVVSVGLAELSRESRAAVRAALERRRTASAEDRGLDQTNRPTR